MPRTSEEAASLAVYGVRGSVPHAARAKAPRNPIVAGTRQDRCFDPKRIGQEHRTADLPPARESREADGGQRVTRPVRRDVRHASAEPGISDREGGAEPASRVMKRGLTVPPADITVKLRQ